jgi:hypothetical protein
VAVKEYDRADAGALYEPSAGEILYNGENAFSSKSRAAMLLPQTSPDDFPEFV